MSSRETLIIIPGLGDKRATIEAALRIFWQSLFQVTIVFHEMPWSAGERDFAPKLQRLLNLVDKLHARGKTISIIGTSAGGSAAINVFYYKNNKVRKVISICGRLSEGQRVHPTLTEAGKKSTSFVQSVRLAEKLISKIPQSRKRDILTIRPLWDETVPVTTTTINGARNIQIFSAEHLLSIFLAMTFYSNTLYSHIRSK